MQGLVNEIYDKRNIEKSLRSEVLDQLEVLEAEEEDEGSCECRSVICIIVEASNLRKWIKLLFAEH
jgi:hypothetical protein